MDQRTRFVVAAERRKELGLSFSDLCASYGVSRKTGYKWLRRWEAEGAAGLREHSRVAHHRPHAMRAEVCAALVELKGTRPSWGAKKLRGRLMRLFPETRWPAVSTIHELLRREGLVRRAPRRTVYTVKSRPVCEVRRPNDVWAADYKGWVLLKNGTRCDPFTLTDLCSRKALTIRAHEVFSAKAVWSAMESAFRSYGLPWVVRTDTGVPFGARGGLSRLTVKLTKLGVRHEFCRPGKPTDNGKHERFHRTLSEEAMTPPSKTMPAQQKRFDRFRRDYNQVRPHEALGNLVPDDVWRPCERHYAPDPDPFEYEGWFQVRRVNKDGHAKFAGKKVHVSASLRGELIGFEQVGDETHRVWFGPLLVGLLEDKQTRLLRGDLNAMLHTQRLQPHNTPPQ